MATRVGSNPVNVSQLYQQGTAAAQLESQISKAAQTLSPTEVTQTLAQLQDVSGFDATSLTNSPPSAPNGTLTAPQDQYTNNQQGLTETYSEKVALGEQTETVRHPVQQNSAAKKGQTPQVSTKDETTRIPPAEVEKKLRTDPAFKARMEQQLGGKIILDDVADGNISVEKTRPKTQTQQSADLEAPLVAAAMFLDRLANLSQQIFETFKADPALADAIPATSDASSTNWAKQMSDAIAQYYNLTPDAETSTATAPDGAFGNLTGWPDGYLSQFGDANAPNFDAQNASQQLVDANVQFNNVLENAVDLFDAAKTGMGFTPGSF